VRLKPISSHVVCEREMSRPKRKRRTREELREELLRPCACLGYDHDALGLHLLECQAYEIAEIEFRRAIYLNPFEPHFQADLARCLCAMQRYAQAREWIGRALQRQPDNESFRRLLERIEVGIKN